MTDAKILHDVLMLAADTSRSRAYLNALGARNLRPALAVVLNCEDAVKAASQATETSLFNNRTPLVEQLSRIEVPVTELSVRSVNDPNVILALSRMPQNYVIYSGPPGALLRKELFDVGKRYLHVHPGRLPGYRGSTPMYYSLLAEGLIAATALFLNLNIDEGEVIRQKPYAAPKDMTTMDRDFDPWMRADLLAEVLLEYSRTGNLESRPQAPAGPGPYYIIHPVLKHLAILASGQ